MKNLTFKTKISVLFSIYSTLIILVTGIAFSVIYYAIVERDLRYTIMQKTKEVQDENIVYANNKISYKVGDQGETLTYHLRTNDLSAFIVDVELTRIGTFGIYRNLDDQNIFDSVIDKNQLKEIIKDKTSVFSRKSLIDNRQYEVYTTPLYANEKVIGLIQVARETDFIGRIVNANINILAMILPLSIVISWLAGYLITSRSFKPLNKLILHMQNMEPLENPQKIKATGNKQDEIVLLANTFNQLLDRINEGVEKQKDFVSNASHELKTPLTRAISSLDIALLNMNKGEKEDAKLEILDVQKELFGLNDVLNSLLTLTKISRSNVSDVKKETVEVKKSINEIINKLKEKMNEKNLTIHVNCNDNVKIRMIEKHFTMLLNNLISNAIKYNNNFGRINIDFRVKENSGTLKITDTGIGLNKESLKHIFDRFYRAKKVEKVVSGVGIGMTIVKQICEANNLKISVSSEDYRGMTTTIENFKII